MPISQRELRSAAARLPSHRIVKSRHEAIAQRGQSAFLCHSHKDSALVEGLVVLLAESGWTLYVDWKDHEMVGTPGKEIADNVRRKISEHDWFFFLATAESCASRWCPWEIGVADSRKPNERLLIIPTVDDSGRWHGNEYLQLYTKVDTGSAGGLALFAPGSQSAVPLRNL